LPKNNNPIGIDINPPYENTLTIIQKIPLSQKLDELSTQFFNEITPTIYPSIKKLKTMKETGFQIEIQNDESFNKNLYIVTTIGNTSL